MTNGTMKTKGQMAREKFFADSYLAFNPENPGDPIRRPLTPEMKLSRDRQMAAVAPAQQEQEQRRQAAITEGVKQREAGGGYWSSIKGVDEAIAQQVAQRRAQGQDAATKARIEARNRASRDRLQALADQYDPAFLQAVQGLAMLQTPGGDDLPDTPPSRLAATSFIDQVLGLRPGEGQRLMTEGAGVTNLPRAIQDIISGRFGTPRDVATGQEGMTSQDAFDIADLLPSTRFGTDLDPSVLAGILSSRSADPRQNPFARLIAGLPAEQRQQLLGVPIEDTSPAIDMSAVDNLLQDVDLTSEQGRTRLVNELKKILGGLNIATTGPAAI